MNLVLKLLNIAPSRSKGTVLLFEVTLKRGGNGSTVCTLDSGINVGVRLLILGLFSNGYVLIKGGTIINFFIFYFLDIFFACFTLAMYKKINLSVILRGGYAYSMGYVYCFCKKFQGLCLFKGVRLFRSLEYMKNTYVMIVATKLHPIKICRSTLRKFIKRKKKYKTHL